MARETYQIEVGERSLKFESDGERLFDENGALRLSVERLSDSRYSILYKGKSVTVTVEELADDAVSIRAPDGLHDISWKDRRAALLAAMGFDAAADKGHNEVKAPMPGLVLDVLVDVGQPVVSGDGLVVLEAMKMENELRASIDGTVSAVHVSGGEAVGKGAILIEIDA